MADVTLDILKELNVIYYSDDVIVSANGHVVILFADTADEIRKRVAELNIDHINVNIYVHDTKLGYDEEFDIETVEVDADVYINVYGSRIIPIYRYERDNIRLRIAKPNVPADAFDDTAIARIAIVRMIDAFVHNFANVGIRVNPHVYFSQRERRFDIIPDRKELRDIINIIVANTNIIYERYASRKRLEHAFTRHVTPLTRTLVIVPINAKHKPNAEAFVDDNGTRPRSVRLAMFVVNNVPITQEMLRAALPLIRAVELDNHIRLSRIYGTANIRETLKLIAEFFNAVPLIVSLRSFFKLRKTR